MTNNGPSMLVVSLSSSTQCQQTNPISEAFVPHAGDLGSTVQEQGYCGPSSSVQQSVGTCCCYSTQSRISCVRTFISIMIIEQIAETLVGRNAEARSELEAARSKGPL